MALEQDLNMIVIFFEIEKFQETIDIVPPTCLEPHICANVIFQSFLHLNVTILALQNKPF